MKVAVITPLFALSGVPLAQTRFARSLASAGCEVDLVFGQIDDSLPFPELPGVNVINLGKTRVRRLFVPIREHILKKKPDVIFCAEDHLNIVVLIALIVTGSKAKFSGSSRVTPFDTYSRIPLTKRWWLKQLMRLVAPRANVLSCVSKDMVEQYRTVFPRLKHVAIYNIVDDTASRVRMTETLEHEWFIRSGIPLLIAAGRLAPWKGFDVLIDAVALLIKERPLKLLILGDGPDRAELIRQVRARGVEEFVHFEGYVSNPLKYYCQADVFVLSSRVEGLPNVLVEAMMCGCSPVSTDCPTGPREVLRDGELGQLVPVDDPVALAEGIKRVLEAPVARDKLDEAVLPFAEAEVLKQHFAHLGLPLSSKVA